MKTFIFFFLNVLICWRICILPQFEVRFSIVVVAGGFESTVDFVNGIAAGYI